MFFMLVDHPVVASGAYGAERRVELGGANLGRKYVKTGKASSQWHRASHKHMVALFRAARIPVLFRGGSFRQLTYDGEHICLLMAGFHDHENRDGEQKATEKMVKSHKVDGAPIHNRADPVQQQP